MKLIHTKIDNRSSLIFYFLAMIFLMGCVSGYAGKMVPLQHRIAAAEGGPHRGLWTGKHIEFNYTYSRTSDQVDISGDISFTKSSVYKSARDFTLWMHFVDSEGKIVESIALLNTSSFGTGQKINKQNLSLPAGTNSLTFSYRGESGSREDPYIFHGSPFSKR